VTMNANGAVAMDATPKKNLKHRRDTPRIGGVSRVKLSALTRGGRTVPPTFGDVDQGNLSDAWLMACFAAVAHAQPAQIMKRIDRLDDGAFQVRVGKHTLFRITPEFSGEGYADPMPNGQEDTMWCALLEKAWAKREAGAYTLLEVGNPSRALEDLSGENGPPDQHQRSHRPGAPVDKAEGGEAGRVGHRLPHPRTGCGDAPPCGSRVRGAGRLRTRRQPSGAPLQSLGHQRKRADLGEHDPRDRDRRADPRRAQLPRERLRRT
jgi:hypothetical protein